MCVCIYIIYITYNIIYWDILYMDHTHTSLAPPTHPTHIYHEMLAHLYIIHIYTVRCSLSWKACSPPHYITCSIILYTYIHTLYYIISYILHIAARSLLQRALCPQIWACRALAATETSLLQRSLLQRAVCCRELSVAESAVESALCMLLCSLRSHDSLHVSTCLVRRR